MPALPWSQISTVDPGTELTVMASKLPLRFHRHIPAFLRWTLRIRSQLAQAPGLVGYSLDANLLRKRFWTVSAWTSQAAIETFVGREPHATAMAAIRPHMDDSAFVFWTATSDDLPISWADVRERIGKKTGGGKPR